VKEVLMIWNARSNAMMYNGKGSQVYEMAEEMLRESENQIAHFRSMQHDFGR
jgi:bromodomain-containing protein 8